MVTRGDEWGKNDRVNVSDQSFTTSAVNCTKLENILKNNKNMIFTQ